MAIVGASITNVKAIENALVKAFEKWAEEDINDKHWEKQFRDMSKWNWPNETLRQSGPPLVTSPRDIYDLGLLYDSGKQSFDVQSTANGASADWHWDAKNSSEKEYARHVHDGTKFMDGRPFTEDIAVEASFFFKEPGKDLVARVQTALDVLTK
jgi:hypothetical protein